MGVDETPGWRRRVTALVVIGAVVAPAIRVRDSFPFSTYPIYANARGRIATFNTAVGIDRDGEQRRLSLSTIASTDDPLIAQSAVANAVRGGRADELCAQIASRTPADIAAIEVVEERHDVVAWVTGDESIVSRSVHARCEVPE